MERNLERIEEENIDSFTNDNGDIDLYEKINDAGDEEPEQGDSKSEDQEQEDERLVKLRNIVSRKSKRERILKKELHEKEEEIRRLKEFNVKAQTGAINGWEAGIQNAIELSQAKLRNAIEHQDVDSHIAASSEIAELNARLNELRGHKSSLATEDQRDAGRDKVQRRTEEPETNQYEETEEYDPDLDENPNRGEFMARNPWANPSSLEFDEAMFGEIDAEATRLSNLLKRQGRENLVYGKSFFRALDNYAKENFKKVNRGLSDYVKKGGSRVAPVNAASSSNRVKQYSEIERNMAREAGLTPEQYHRGAQAAMNYIKHRGE